MSRASSTTPAAPRTPEQARKRPRLSEEAHGTLATRCADEELTLEVDNMILDYLVWNALDLCLQSDLSFEEVRCGQALATAEDFLNLFRNQHPRHEFDAEMRFRLLLLQLGSLLTQRHVNSQHAPSLESLSMVREMNKARAVQWMESTGCQPTRGHDTRRFEEDLPMSQAYLHRNRAQAFSAIQVPTEGNVPGCSFDAETYVALLDVLPLFVRVCAACQALHGSNMTETLMHLTTNLMLKACLEQYLVLGASGTDSIDEAFAWGYSSQEMYDANNTDVPSDQELINNLFTHEEDSSEIVEWTECRDRAVALILEHRGGGDGLDQERDTLVAHLEHLDSTIPTSMINHQLRDVLSKLSASIEQPILAQLENGHLAGMSEAETRRFLHSCGLDETHFLRRSRS